MARSIREGGERFVAALRKKRPRGLARQPKAAALAVECHLIVAGADDRVAGADAAISGCAARVPTITRDRRGRARSAKPNARRCCESGTITESSRAGRRHVDQRGDSRRELVYRALHDLAP